MTTARPVPLPRHLVATLLLLGAVAALVVGAAPAAAHEGPGVLTVEADEPTDTGRHYVVRLTWQNDGHPAARDTTLTATAFAPDGTAQTPVPMTAVDDDGRFEATVNLPEPGQWRVNFTSVTPTASVDAQADVAAPSTTTTDAPDSTATSAAPDEADTDAGGQATAASDEDDGSAMGIVLVLAAVVLIGAAGAAVVLLGRRRSGPGPGGDASGDAAADSQAASVTSGPGTSGDGAPTDSQPASTET